VHKYGQTTVVTLKLMLSMDYKKYLPVKVHAVSENSSDLQLQLTCQTASAINVSLLCCGAIGSHHYNVVLSIHIRILDRSRTENIAQRRSQ
jgi:hypothetical protein